MAEREAGVARSAQHAIHVLPHAPTVIARFLAPALERVAEDADATQLLVITPDADTALAIADIARSISSRATPIVPISAAARGGRLLASRVTPAIAAAPSTLVSLLRSSAVKLDGVRALVVAWADELFEAREEEALEIVLAEIPKDASRTVVTDRLTPQVEALVERHLRRASRQGGDSSDTAVADLAIRYVTTTSSGRRTALRRLLDELDPPSVIVLASDEHALAEARATVASLGYEGEALVRVESQPVAEGAALVVFYDLPVTADQVAKVADSTPAQVVALVAPRQVPALRRLTTGLVEPLDVSHVSAKARARDERVRSTLRAELQAGFPAREIMALEPLLAEFDGIEIAAAALRVIERDRSENRARRADAERPVERVAERTAERPRERATAPSPERPSSRGETGYTRVFLSIGDRDGVRAGDLVGAIAGESGITSDRIGKLEIRDSHTVAEIAADDAAVVVEKMNGVSLKGRRITARVDDRPAPRSREGGRGDGPRGFRGGGREGGRGGFGAPRRERSFRDGGGREGSRDGGREGRSREGSREGGREGRSREGGSREGRFSREGRPPRTAGRDRFGERRPRRDDDRPRGRGGEFRDRSDEGRVPRAAREREEWSERADRVRHARRPRRDDT